MHWISGQATAVLHATLNLTYSCQHQEWQVPPLPHASLKASAYQSLQMSLAIAWRMDLGFLPGVDLSEAFRLSHILSVADLCPGDDPECSTRLLCQNLRSIFHRQPSSEGSFFHLAPRRGLHMTPAPCCWTPYRWVKCTKVLLSTSQAARTGQNCQELLQRWCPSSSSGTKRIVPYRSWVTFYFEAYLSLASAGFGD